ncbi:tripartite tricarboxylate transporter substrate binding protein [bacterium]|nr:MAG: tripartite tricarboxylate transporter substrate binding protein [bacterium]
MSRFVIIFALLLTLIPGTINDVFAQTDNYPNKPIRLIVPFVPGGGTDIVARSLAQKLTEVLGKSVIVDNRGGAGGTIGAELAVRAVPDGYTMIMCNTSYATNAAMYNLPYDPVNDITPVGLIGETGYLVVVHPGTPAKSLKELIAMAKAKPGSLNYGSPGTGSLGHLATELFDMMAGTKMTHVPYKGTAPALNELLGSYIQLMFGTVPSTIPLVKTNRLRAIAITTAKRSNALPDVPTISETLPGYEATQWYAVWGPKNLPKDIMIRWNKAIAQIVQMPDMKERMAGEGLEPLSESPEQFRQVLKVAIEKWTKVVKQANIKVNP